MATFLQLFILVDVFFVGVLTAIALRHARAHFWPSTHDAADAALSKPSVDVLPDAVKKRLLDESQVKFQLSLNNAAQSLEKELGISSGQINKLVEQLGTKIVSDELERYQQELTQLHKQAEADMSSMRGEMASHENELKAKLANEIETEKQALIHQIDSRLADAVASFLLETLQHNVDLGAQGPYLTAMLEEHKSDFVKEVADEAPTS